MRIIDSRIDVLRDGVKVTELIPTSSVTITSSADSEIKSSLSGSFLPNNSVKWEYDEIRPVLFIDGEEINCGIFAPATITHQTYDNGESVGVEAYDRCWIVKQRKTEDTLHFSQYANYVQTIQSMLLDCGIGMTISTQSDYRFRTDREDWELGTDYLTIINQLLEEINYSQLWFNSDGYAVIEPKKYVEASNVTREYSSENVKTLLKSNSSVSVDLFNAPNHFVAICTNPDGDGILKATASNNSPVSPLSIMRRGKKIVSIINVDNIPTQQALQEYVDLVCIESMFIGQKISIETGLQKPTDLNSVVSLVLPTTSGICREVGYEMTLTAGGSMVHTLEKVMEVNA